MSASPKRHNVRTAIHLSDLDQRHSSFRVEFLLEMNRTLGQNQFASWTHASLKEVTTVGDTVGASHCLGSFRFSFVTFGR
jgi:hypothetical protein